MVDEGDIRLTADDSVVREASAGFGRPAPREWRDLGGGWTTNLLIDDPDDPWLIRIHQRTTGAERLRAVQAARIAAAEAGLPTAAPFPSTTGTTMITLASGHLAEAEPFLAWRDKMKTPERLRVGFELLGRLHDVLRTVPLPPAAGAVRYANHLATADTLPAARAGAERIRSWGRADLTAYADEVVPHLEAVVDAELALADGLRHQIVHGDFWDNNVGLTDGRVTALLDFDFMAERSRIDDLALPCYFFLLEPGRSLPTAADRALVSGLADAYDTGTVAPLTTEERRALPLAIARQPAWSVGRWVLELPEPEAVQHAEKAAQEFAVARRVLAELDRWQDLLAPA